MTSKAFILTPADGYRAAFYKDPDWDLSPRDKDREFLIPPGHELVDSTPVLHFAVNPAPTVANGDVVGFAYATTPEGAVRAFSGPVGDFLGIVEPGRDARTAYASEARSRAVSNAMRLRDAERVNEIKIAAMEAAKNEENNNE